MSKEKPEISPTLLTISDGEKPLIQITLKGHSRHSFVDLIAEHVSPEEIELQITQAIVALAMLAKDIAEKNGKDKPNYESVMTWIPRESKEIDTHANRS